LEDTRVKAPEGTENLSQGNTKMEVRFRFSSKKLRTYDSYKCKSVSTLSWNEIFSILSPYMIDEAEESVLKLVLARFIASKEGQTIKESEEFKNLTDFKDFQVIDEDFQTIKVQLRALGLMVKNTKQRSVKDTETYWTLTHYGDTVMTRLRAIYK